MDGLAATVGAVSGGVIIWFNKPWGCGFYYSNCEPPMSFGVLLIVVGFTPLVPDAATGSFVELPAIRLEADLR